MNTKREIVDVFDGSPSSDLPPPAVFTQTGTVELMRSSGASWPEANFDPDKMARLALEFPKQYGFATVRIPFCVTAEAERLGADVNPGSGDRQPSIVGSKFSNPEGIDDVREIMSVDEFVSGGRVAMTAEVADRISRDRGDLFLTVGMQCPSSVAGQLLGAENFMMASMMEPDKALAWVEAMVPFQCAYAKRLSESADNVLVIGDGSTDLQSPETFRDVGAPRLKKVVSAVSSFSTIHSCGDTRLNLDVLVSMGADGLSLEASHDPEWFLSQVDHRCLMFGSVDPVRTLLMKGPEDVAGEARTYADLGFDIITPECGVPPHTRGENLLALSRYRGQ